MTIQPSLIIANAVATEVDHCLSLGNVMDTNAPPTNPPGQDEGYSILPQEGLTALGFPLHLVTCPKIQ